MHRIWLWVYYNKIPIYLYSICLRGLVYIYIYISIYVHIYIYIHTYMGGVPTIRGTLFGGAPIIRIMICWSLFWGPLMLGNYHICVYIYMYVYMYNKKLQKVMAMQKCTVAQLSCKNLNGKGLRARDEFSPLCIASKP